MDIYGKLIENPLFFKWAFAPNAQVEAFWQAYLDEHPADAAAIVTFRDKVKLLSVRHMPLSDVERETLKARILAEVKAEEPTKPVVFRLRGWLRYAAVAMLCFSLGIVAHYYISYRSNSDLLVEELSPQMSSDKPTLFLDGVKQIALDSTRSSLRYSVSNQIVVNNERVIQTHTTGKHVVQNKLVIPYGNRSKVTLSDGTEVWLNAGSQLIYPSAFVKKNRTVALIGEAFFKVAKDAKHPFIVQAGELDVQVLGTEFNVSAYPEDKLLRTVLAEGRVSIRAHDAGFFEPPLILKPNQMAEFDRQQAVTAVKAVDVDLHILWTQGLMKLSESNLPSVLQRLERYYNLRFQIECNEIEAIKLNGKLDLSQSADEVFEYLSKVASVRFVPVGDHLYEVNME